MQTEHQLLAEDGDSALAQDASSECCEVVHLTAPALLLARAIARQGAANYHVVAAADSAGSWLLTLRDGHPLGRYEQREQAVAVALAKLRSDRVGGRIAIYDQSGSSDLVEPPSQPIPAFFVLQLSPAGQLQVATPGGALLGELAAGSLADRAAVALAAQLPVGARPAYVADADIPDMVGWLGKFRLYAALSIGS